MQEWEISSSLFALPAKSIETRWASPENPLGEPGKGGSANGGRKGRPCLSLRAGEAFTMAQAENVSGTVRRIWATIDNRSPLMLRGLRLDFYWDGNESPAFSVPFGDFFGMGLGRTAPFENVFFSNPEGRSFNCYLPMPFRRGFRMVITNETQTDLRFLFYDINYTLNDEHTDATGYLHAYFRRENPTTLQQDYTFLPTVRGRGRFLGVNFGVQADMERYGRSWWGEGEVKYYKDGDDFYTDGDLVLPTLCGTGTEDFIGTAWAQGQYANRYQGCPVADHEKLAYCFYRYHVPDALYFNRSLRGTIQQIGGAMGNDKKWLRERGETLYKAAPGLMVAEISEDDAEFLMFERADDWSSCAYFYLDRPLSNLPSLSPLEERVANL